jgi:hypothetical protein
VACQSCACRFLYTYFLGPPFINSAMSFPRRQRFGTAVLTDSSHQLILSTLDQVKTVVATQAAVIRQATTSMSRAALSLMSRTQVPASSRQPSYATHSCLKTVKIHRTIAIRLSPRQAPQAPMLPFWCLQPSKLEPFLPTELLSEYNICLPSASAIYWSDKQAVLSPVRLQKIPRR